MRLPSRGLTTPEGHANNEGTESAINRKNPSMHISTKPPRETKAKVRKTQRHFFFMAGFIEETEEAASGEQTPSAPPPAAELVKAFTEERQSRPELRKAAVAVVIPFPKRVASR